MMLSKNILVNVIDSEEKNDFRKKTFLVEIMLVVVNPLKIINVPKAVAATKHVKGNHEFLSTHPPTDKNRVSSINDNSFPPRTSTQRPPEPVFSDVDIGSSIFSRRPVDRQADAPWTHLRCNSAQKYFSGS